MTTETGYEQVLGVSDAERERLVRQAQDVAPEARWLLDRIGVEEGSRAIDLGCGPIGILDLLGEQVGHSGEVVGVDLEPRFVAWAGAIARERGFRNVRVLEGDARATGLPRASFDVVHERLVLIGPDRERVVHEMLELARPGGVVAAQEVDVTTSFCEPAHPAWERLVEAFRESTHRIGADVAVGRRLPGLLAAAGAVDVVSEVHARLDAPGAPRRMQLPTLVTHARGPLIKGGILTEPELDGMLAALRSHLADPRTLVFGGLMFQAWGRRPPA